MDLNVFDKRTITAISSRGAGGCNGWDDADAVDGKEIFVWAERKNQAWFSQLEARWADLWFDSDELEKKAVVEAKNLGFTFSEKPLRPVWDENWTGTRQEYLEATSKWIKLLHTYEKEVNDTLSKARITLFTQLGGTAVDIIIPCERILVYDFGCQCGCENNSEGGGLGQLVVLENKVFIACVNTNIESVLEEAEDVAQSESLKVTKKNEQSIEEARTNTLLLRVEEDDNTLSLEYSQWVTDKKRKVEVQSAQIIEAVEKENWKGLRRLIIGSSGEIVINDPVACKNLVRQRVMNSYNVRVLAEAELLQLYPLFCS